MSTTNANTKRRGFTLLEISLVLAILVVMAMLAAPVLQGTLNQERLRKGTESIAADWTKTRALAMQTGETQLWVCQLGTSNFANGAATSSYDGATGATSGFPGGGAAGVGSPTLPVTADQLLSQAQLTGQLPDSIVISSAIVSELDVISEMGQSSTTSESGNVTMFFYPDGTSSSAKLTLKNENSENMAMRASINGIAGTVRVLNGSSSSSSTGVTQ